jgi:hypothetical protein
VAVPQVSCSPASASLVQRGPPHHIHVEGAMHIIIGSRAIVVPATLLEATNIKLLRLVNEHHVHNAGHGKEPRHSWPAFLPIILVLSLPRTLRVHSWMIGLT